MDLSFFLQISNAGSAVADTAASDAGDKSITLFELLIKGGIFMIPLFLLSVFAIYIFVERLLTLRKALNYPPDFMNNVKKSIQNHDLKAAKVQCAQNSSPIARMVEKGISRIGTPMKTIEATIENVSKVELYKLEKNLSSLATISGAAPMIGFLGTVTGMIQAFIAIAQEEGSVSPKTLSSGIYEAMITTATGLTIGVIAYICYNYLVAKVEKIVHNMEYTSVEFMDAIQEPAD